VILSRSSRSLSILRSFGRLRDSHAVAPTFMHDTPRGRRAVRFPGTRPIRTCSPAATSIWATWRTILDLPAPLGPSTLTNKPRSWLEKGRSFIAVSCSFVAQRFEAERPITRSGGQVYEQVGGYEHVIRRPMWGEVFWQALGQTKDFDQHAELVALLLRE
jgi:hypothetical protein